MDLTIHVVAGGAVSTIALSLDLLPHQNLSIEGKWVRVKLMIQIHMGELLDDIRWQSPQKKVLRQGNRPKNNGKAHTVDAMQFMLLGMLFDMKVRKTCGCSLYHGYSRQSWRNDRDHIQYLKKGSQLQSCLLRNKLLGMTPLQMSLSLLFHIFFFSTLPQRFPILTHPFFECLAQPRSKAPKINSHQFATFDRKFRCALIYGEWEQSCAPQIVSQ